MGEQHPDGTDSGLVLRRCIDYIHPRGGALQKKPTCKIGMTCPSKKTGKKKTVERVNDMEGCSLQHPVEEQAIRGNLLVNAQSLQNQATQKGTVCNIHPQKKRGGVNLEGNDRRSTRKIRKQKSKN